MSQRGLANSLKAGIIGIGMCGLIIYFYFLPAIGKVILRDMPQYGHGYIPWMIFLWITGIPCYLVLLCCWKVASEIGRDNSFSYINAKMLKYIAALAAFDSCFLFVGSGIFFTLDMCGVGLLLLLFVVVFFGATVTVAAAALSHLIYKAAELAEQNELTI